MLDNNFETIISLIEKRKQNAYKKINEEIISLHWEVGEFLSELSEKSNYGDKVVEKASKYMKENHPTIKGFTRSNMYRMVQFYNTYKNYEKVAPLARQVGAIIYLY